MTYSMNIKNKKGCLNVWLFFYFHMEILGPYLIIGELQIHGNYRMQLMPCYYQRRYYILYQSFPIPMFLKQEIVTQSK